MAVTVAHVRTGRLRSNAAVLEYLVTVAHVRTGRLPSNAAVLEYLEITRCDTTMSPSLKLCLQPGNPHRRGCAVMCKSQQKAHLHRICLAKEDDLRLAASQQLCRRFQDARVKRLWQHDALWLQQHTDSKGVRRVPLNWGASRHTTSTFLATSPHQTWSGTQLPSHGRC